MTALPLALSLGGSALSGLFGGARDPGPSNVLQNSRADALAQSGRYLSAFYGSNYRGGEGPASAGSWDWINGGDPSNFSNFRYGDGTNGRAGTTAAGNGPGAGGAGSTGLYGGTTPFGNAPILQQMESASTAGQREGQNSLNDFNSGSEQAYRQAQNFGTGQAAVTRQNAALALKNANAQSLARLNGSGLGGSSIASDQLGANSASNTLGLNTALANLNDQATGMKIQQRNQSTAGRAALQGQIGARNDALRMMPIQGQLGALGSPVANPFSVQGGSAPVNSSNQMLTNLGNTGSQLGGMYLANSLYNQGGGGSQGLAGYNQVFGGQSGGGPAFQGMTPFGSP